MREMIERVAKVLEDFHLPVGFGYMSEAERLTVRSKQARAAIEAMRAPTEVMSNEGWDTACAMMTKAGCAIGGETPIWQAMIDAALSEDGAEPDKA